jgi:hypothetical protein
MSGPSATPIGVFIVTTIGLAEFVGKRNYSRLKMLDAPSLAFE